MKEDRCIILDINATNIGCVYVKKGPNGTFTIIKKIKESINVNEELKSMTKTISIEKVSGIGFENQIEIKVVNLIREIKAIGKFNKKIIVGIGDDFCSMDFEDYNQTLTKHIDIRKTLDRDKDKEYSRKYMDSDSDYRYFCGALLHYSEHEEVILKHKILKRDKAARIKYGTAYCNMILRYLGTS